MRKDSCLLGGTIVLVVALASPSRAEWDLEQRAWYATDIVVAQQQERDVKVLETWQGSLTPGAVIRDLELPAMPLAVAQADKDEQAPSKPAPHKTVSGQRVVLFLRHRPTAEREPPPKHEWEDSHYDPGKSSAVWIDDDQAYALVRIEKPAGQELRPVKLAQKELTEKEIKQQVLAMLAIKQKLAEARAIADPAQRAGALERLATGNYFQRSNATQALAKCGPLALPALERIMRQYRPNTYQVAYQLARAAGAKQGVVMTAVLEEELKFWKETAPTLPAGWLEKIDPDHQDWKEYRNRLDILPAALRSIRRMDYVAGRGAVEKLREFFDSLPAADRTNKTPNPLHGIIYDSCRVLDVLDEPDPLEGADANGKSGEEKRPATAPVTFSDRKSHNGKPIDDALINEVNALPSRAAQIQFLTSLLPSKDAQAKRLDKRQEGAMFLLGLTGSPEVAATLIDRLDSYAQGYAAKRALIYLGEPAVEPLVEALQTSGHVRSNFVMDALLGIKGKKFGQFVYEIVERKDLKLSESTIDTLLGWPVVEWTD